MTSSTITWGTCYHLSELGLGNTGETVRNHVDAPLPCQCFNWVNNFLYRNSQTGNILGCVGCVLCCNSSTMALSGKDKGISKDAWNMEQKDKPIWWNIFEIPVYEGIFIKFMRNVYYGETMHAFQKEVRIQCFNRTFQLKLKFYMIFPCQEMLFFFVIWDHVSLLKSWPYLQMWGIRIALLFSTGIVYDPKSLLETLGVSPSLASRGTGLPSLLGGDFLLPLLSTFSW